MIEFPSEDTKWAWLAGVIEGEGCLNVTFVKKRYYHSQIVITNTQRELLEEMQTIVGGRIYAPTLKQHRNWKQKLYLMNFNYNLQLTLLCKIKPFLVTKKRQAELMIEFLNLKLAGKKVSVTPRYAEIYQEMKRLNVRGLSKKEV